MPIRHQLKIATIIGARPQFIKAAMLAKELSSRHNVNEILIHTGQHFDKNMSDIFFDELDIPPPNYNLGIHSSTHGAMTGKMLIEIEKVLLTEKPNLVVVYGDTDSTLAGALAAAKLNIPVAHIEAGLRSFNRTMPEETNRVLTDHIAELLFAPTPTAVKNLQAENRPEAGILLSGDIMFDAALTACQLSDEASLLKQYNIQPKCYTLATLHRAENTDHPERLITWLEALNEVAKHETVILPLHPRTQARMTALGKSSIDYPSLRLIKPVGYGVMATLTKNARLVVTDSGGLQKEAYFHQVPGLILRQETEWVELIESGWSQLIDCNQEAFLHAFKIQKKLPVWKKNLFGKGQTAEYIAQALLNYFA